jgi:DNA-binding XRE family transcriptional regulator
MLTVTNFGLVIKKYRESQYMTQQMLADALNVSKQSVCRWETGLTLPRLSTIKKITEYIDTHKKED